MALREKILELFAEQSEINIKRTSRIDETESYAYELRNDRILAGKEGKKKRIPMFIFNEEAFREFENQIISVAQQQNGIIYYGNTYDGAKITEIPELATSLSGIAHRCAVTRRSRGADDKSMLYAGVYLALLLEKTGYAERSVEVNQYVTIKPEYWS